MQNSGFRFPRIKSTERFTHASSASELASLCVTDLNSEIATLVSSIRESDDILGFKHSLLQIANLLEADKDCSLCAFRSDVIDFLSDFLSSAPDPIPPDLTDSLLWITVLLTLDDRSPPLSLLLEFAAQSLFASSLSTRALAIQAFHNSLLHSGPTADFLWSLNVVHELLSVPAEAADESYARLLFFDGYIAAFRDRLRERELFEITDFCLLHSDVCESVSLMAGIVHCPNGFEIAVLKGLNHCIEKWTQEFPGAAVLAVLNRYALADEQSHWIFEQPGFFRWLAEFVSRASAPEIAEAVALAYRLEPVYLEELTSAGFVRTVVEMLGEVEFALFVPICEFAALAFADLPEDALPEAIGQREAEALARILEVGHPCVVLRALEIIGALCTADQQYFARIAAATALGDALEALDAEEMPLVGQHARLLLRQIDGAE
jgi:hypothetical protein